MTLNFSGSIVGSLLGAIIAPFVFFTTNWLFYLADKNHRPSNNDFIASVVISSFIGFLFGLFNKWTEKDDKIS